MNRKYHRGLNFNLQDESSYDNSNSSYGFFVHKDLLGKVRVHDFMVVVRDFIVGFTTLLSMDNKSMYSSNKVVHSLKVPTLRFSS